MQEGTPQAGKNRNVVWLGFVSLFTDISSEMVFGLVPLFLTGQLGASRATLGLVEGMAEMLGYSSRMVSGAASDRLQQRKPIVLIGYLISTIAKPFFGLAAGWQDILAVRLSDRIGKGIRTSPRDALISESAGTKKMGRAFGIHRSMDQAGAVVGPLVAFALFPIVGYSGIFYLSLLPGAVAVVILALFVRDVRTTARAKSSIALSIRQVMANKSFVVLICIMGLFSIGAFNFSFVILRASDLGLSNGEVLLTYATINITHTIVGYPAGVLADRIGREVLLVASYSTFVLCTILMLVSSSSIDAFVIAAVFGAYIGIAETIQRALVPKFVTSSSIIGTAFGLYNVVIGVAFLVANIVFGFLLDTAGNSAALTYSLTTSVAAIAALCLFMVGRSRARQTSSTV